MPTYQVTCTECGKEKWPTVPERPTGYVCVLCRSMPPAKKAAGRERARKVWQKRRVSKAENQGGPVAGRAIPPLRVSGKPSQDA